MKEQIIKKARELFFTQGIRSVTMDEIAKELAISKKTLYGHFSSKIELLGEVVLGKLGEVSAQYKQIEEMPVGFIEKMEALCSAIYRATDEIGLPFVRDMSRMEPSFFEKIKDKRREIVTRTFTNVFEQGQSEGVVRNDIPTEALIFIFVGAIDNLLVPQVLARLGLSIDQGAGYLFSVLNNGILKK